ncbi:MAG: nucleotidyltransferase domain-containing protein, partial [Gloeomargarita sp. SKYG116]|nr:nucleotidyltransferase domain-containing protein [Gloeomargarita sp. SKYG116]MDW8402405.1 nucleotidyltransferase domain-containing protein [Gloeomargarita sp. SKYGB_i_bin116]
MSFWLSQRSHRDKMIATEKDILDCILQASSPLKVVLFGSRARGDFDAESDYDVLVVVSDETDVRTTKRQLQQALAAQPSPVQLLVKRWSDYLALQGLTVGLWQNIRTDGITLYERTDTTHFTPFPMKTNQDLAQTLLKKAQTDLKSARILSEHLTEIEAIGF